VVEVKAIAALACVLTVPLSYATMAKADSFSSYSDRTYPEYCAVFKRENNEAERKQWEAKLGRAAGILSGHFCIAQGILNNVRRGAYRKGHDPAGTTRRAVRTAIRQINYSASRVPKKHWMMGEIHRAYAEAYTYAGDKEKAAEHEQLATTYAQGPSGGRGGQLRASAARYVSMADRMMQVGLPGEAVELLELAQRLEPDSKAIERKLINAKAALKQSGDKSSSSN
jgi:hypothetical protein